MLRSKNIPIYLLLGLIFIFALLIRIYNLNNYPVGFHQDEASLGYNGYSLLLTGKDDNGNSFPLYIDMFGDNRPSGYHYLTIIPILFFGLTEFATRAPGALFGALSVFPIFFLVISIFKDKKLGLVSALLVSISPWNFVLSRASAEAIVSLFFILLAFGVFYQSLRSTKVIYVVASAILMIASFAFYHTPRVFVPGLFLVFILMFLKKINIAKNTYRIAVFSSFLLVTLIAIFLVFGVSGGTGRFSQVNIFSSFETDFFQTQQIQEDSVAGSANIVSRFFHNKITNISLIFISNYFDYFGFNFLFTAGGLPIWYSIPRMGLLYLAELPFILIGIYYLIKEKNMFYKIPLVWLLIAPVVPAITMDDVPNINRAIVMFPMLNIIAAVGFLFFLRNFKYKKQATVLIVTLFLVNALYFFHQYFYNAKTHKSWYRNNGFSEMMDVVKENYDKYDLIVMSKYQGGIYPLVLFYMKYDPKLYQHEGSPKDKDYGGFGKFFFVPQDCPSVQSVKEITNGKTKLYIGKGDCPDDQLFTVKKYSYIYREDGTKAFRIIYD